jgi:putative ABC transport system substrate-binding protein
VIQRLSRRAFVSSLAALAAGTAITFKPHGTYAQQPATPQHIGVLLVGPSPESKEAQAFRQGLRDAGYAEGRDVVIEWRSADGDYDKVAGLAADLVQSKVDVIVVDSTNAALAAKRATSTIPIVMASVADPVGSGLVVSLARPGGNVTGLSVMLSEISAKRLQLLREALPQVTRVAVLWNPATPWHPKVIEQFKAGAPSLAIELSFVGVRTAEEIGPAFSAVTRTHAEALYVIGDAFFLSHRATLLKLASKARLPVIYSVRQYVDAGALMSYGPNLGDVFRRSAGYVDRILKGAKPSDLPIEQPTKFELVVNLKTAKALGLTIPESVLLQADEVIR